MRDRDKVSICFASGERKRKSGEERERQEKRRETVERKEKDKTEWER